MMRCEVLMIVLIPHIEMKGPSSFLLDKKSIAFVGHKVSKNQC